MSTSEATETQTLGTSSYRRWALPLLRAIDDLGGSATPMMVEARLRELLKDRLNDGQWARVLRGNYVRWARHAFKKAGLLGGQKGTWSLTEAGRQWLKDHVNEPLPTDWNVVELSPEEAGDMSGALETVDVTDFDAYEIPILRLLDGGPLEKQDIYDGLEQAIGSKLIPGDLRFMPRGRQVWKYRTSWALSNLKKEGAIDNPTLARWQLTEAGKNRLKQDVSAWNIDVFRGSKAKVRAAAPGGTVTATAVTLASPWPTKAWRSFAAKFPDVAEAVDQRVRPDLSPSPPAPLSRNVVFYGPPGTGKTFVARELARALTGNREPGIDNRWRLVQFHPSYSYEDFVQGLRPVVDEATVRYKLRRGPFYELCNVAENDPDRFYVLVIDEINRGDPARIFGELLYAIEYRGDEIELAAGGKLVVPPNLVILGTMNSVDRSVALVDYALRRRFAFVRVDPDDEQTGSPRRGELLRLFNKWLVDELGADHALGHSFFMNPSLAKLPENMIVQRIWSNDVRPLLEEYFFAQPDRLRAAEVAWGNAWEMAGSETDDEDEDKGLHGTS